MTKDKKYKKIISAVDNLSLGISMVVATIIGIFLGIFLKNIFGYSWLLWLGVFLGISASFLNVYKAYKRHIKDLDTLKN